MRACICRHRETLLHIMCLIAVICPIPTFSGQLYWSSVRNNSSYNFFLTQSHGCMSVEEQSVQSRTTHPDVSQQKILAEGMAALQRAYNLHYYPQHLLEEILLIIKMKRTLRCGEATETLIKVTQGVNHFQPKVPQQRWRQGRRVSSDDRKQLGWKLYLQRT